MFLGLNNLRIHVRLHNLMKHLKIITKLNFISITVYITLIKDVASLYTMKPC